MERIRPGAYPFEVIKRVAVGVYNDGFIHAGNLAYLALLTLFPFVIVAAAVARLFGQSEGGMEAVVGLLQTMPPDVAELLRKPIADVLQARSGNLLWLGALVGLWTTGSFIETIRDIIRRAYGVTYSRPFWEYRLSSAGIIVASVVIALFAFAISVFLSTIQEFVVRYVPTANTLFLNLFRLAPAVMLFGSLYLLFYSLTPKRYRKSGCRKWPGPGYDLTYGSLAGVIVALIFFFIIGLGVVIGAELNAALAETPEEGLKEGEEAFYHRESV
jgi:membrane protein